MAATGNELVKLSQLKGTIDAIKTKISNVEGEIPTVPTNVSAFTNDSNYATESFVNSSIENVAAYYITKDAQGNAFQTKAQLDAATTFYSGGAVRTLTRNDYCVVLADETHPDVSGTGSTCRYIWNNSWQFQYVVNNSGLTQAQFNAVNSGITAAKVGTYDAYASGKQDKITSTNKLAYSLISGTPTIPDISGKLTGTKWASGGETSESNAYIPYVNEENEEPDWIATYYNNSSVFGFCYSGLNRFKLSKFNNDAGFITSASLPTVPTNVSAFTNDAGYLTQHQDISGKANDNAVVHLTGNETIAGTKSFSSAINVGGINNTSQTHFSFGNNIVELSFLNSNLAKTSDVAYGYGCAFKTKQLMANTVYTEKLGYKISTSTGSGKIFNLPTSKADGTYTLATTGDIPTKISDLFDDSDFVVSSQLPTKLSDLTNDEGFLVSSLSSDCVPMYDGTNNKLVDTNISIDASGNLIKFASGTGYTYTLPNKNGTVAMTSDVTSHHDSTKQDAITSSNKLNYNLLSNTPTIPTQTSQLNNNSGFLTAATLPSGLAYVGTANTWTKAQTFSEDVNVNDLCFSNTNAGSSSIYDFKMYQWNDGFELQTLKNDAANVTAFSVNGNTGVTDFKVRPTVNGSGLALQSELPTIPTNYVTTDTTQTISGTKTFSNDVSIVNGTNEKILYLGQGKFRVNSGGSLIMSGKDGGSIHLRPYNGTGNGVAVSTGAFFPEINAGSTGQKDLGSSSSKWNNVYGRYYQGESLQLTGSFSALNSIGGGFSISDSVNVGMELGRRDGTAGTPYLDFHTDGSASTDYNSRLIATGNQLNVSASGGLYVNSSKVAVKSNFSLSGTTLTISI